MLGAASITGLIGLSLTLGAFLAGLAVSGTPFRHQVQMETGPFRGLLLSFFFMSVGLSVEIGVLATYWPLALAGAASIILVKSVFGIIAARLNGWTAPGSLRLGFLLAQGSEFTLVVLSILVMTTDVIPPLFETITVASVALSLALAPSWSSLGIWLSRRLAERMKEALPPATGDDLIDRRKPIVIFGLTPAGRLVVDALKDHDLPFVAFDADPQRFMSAVADGYQVSFGDAANLRLIEAAGAADAQAVVIGAPRYEVSRDLTPAVERQFPSLTRFVSVDDPEDQQRFSELGMRAWLSKSAPSGIEMAADVLRHQGISDERVVEWISREADRFDTDDMSDTIIGAMDEAA